MSRKSIYAFLAVAAIAGAMASATPAFAINPQPLPPQLMMGFAQFMPCSQSMLNSQPLPSRKQF